MKKSILNWMFAAVVAITGMTMASCSSSDSGDSPTPPAPDPDVPGVTGVNTLTSGIGTWSAAYVTPQGFFAFKENVTRATTSAYEELYYQSSTGTLQGVLMVNKAEKLPVRFILKDITLDFSFLNDSVLEILYDDGKSVKLVDQVTYNKAELIAAMAAAKKDNNLQRALYGFVTLAGDKLGSYPAVNAFVTSFKDALKLDFDAAKSTTAKGLGIDTTSDGTAKFIIDADDYEVEVVAKIYYKISVWTGKASFRVGGSSCTLSGTVFCADPSYNTYGTYGIVCDTKKENLELGKAAWKGEAKAPQDEETMNFDVDFRGFKKATTYYYRAYYKFNSADHGMLKFKYDNGTSEITYDTEIKEFRTADQNYLDVSVIMVMDISGSMSDEIGMVKNNATDFYDLFKGKCDAADIKLTGLNTQVITYSDINVDYEKSLSESPVYDMTKDEEHSAFETYVNNINLAYGGDAPESALEALYAAFYRDWGVDDGFHRQVVILWTDATYKTVNEGICKDDDGNPMFTARSYEQVQGLWDAMPTGRRMILFAPYGGKESNSGVWDDFDEWKNVMHKQNSTESFNNFDLSLDYIISELTGGDTKDAAPKRGKKLFRPTYIYQPN